ncbi:DNA repair protein RecO [Dokdonella sp.]|uniref:DNA repair protein RecO n=1 Tax=Dokdonella sp. TaxID=2291710 RepID=UPI003784475B
MRIEQQPAYVLHARAYRETSLLLELFTRDHGRVGVVARGVRRERSRIPRGVLQPLQPLLLDWSASGELGTLIGAEAASTPFALSGEALLSAIYLNELVLRLSGRGDPHPAAFGAYADCLARLATGTGIGWTLRRFERDLLADLGYALLLDRCATGDAIEPHADYGYDAEAGPVEWRAGSKMQRIRGSALLALDRDEAPAAEQLAQLRRLMRSLIRHHLGGELNAWSMTAAAAGGSRSST